MHHNIKSREHTFNNFLFTIFRGFISFWQEQQSPWLVFSLDAGAFMLLRVIPASPANRFAPSPSILSSY